MWTWWEVFATFSGPIATALAAGTVAGITYKFANVQAEIAKSQRDIAKSQRDIAYDKLKSDLFSERYEILSVAGELIDYSLKKVAERKSGGMTVMLRKLNEARFFFPRIEAAIFGDVGRLVHKHEIALNDILLHKDNEEKRVEAGDRADAAAKELRKLRVKLPELLQSELGFSQLTTARP